ncbi:MAG: amidohydrolase family protein [Flavobacteriales bacterium]|nr:amidohydrolase family protein [Flavobacteriales bacterium]
MQKITLLLFVLLLTVQAFSQKVLIKNINIIPISTDTLLKNQSVLLEGGIIKAIASYKKLHKKNKSAEIIDGTGKYLMPGLTDMHVHFPEENKIGNLLLSNIVAGVTHIRIMNSQVNQLELREKLSKLSNLISPTIHYSHLIRGEDIFTEQQADSLMKQVKKDDIQFIKLFGLSNEETFNNLIKSANKYDVIICGHYPSYWKDNQSNMVEMEKVLKSGFKSIEHLAGYSWLSDSTQLNNAIKLTKEHNVYNCPTIDFFVMFKNLQYPDEYKNRITYQFLPHRITQEWDSTYVARIEQGGGREKIIDAKNKYLPKFNPIQKLLVELYKNDCPLLIGGDSGGSFQADGFNVYEEMVNWSNIGIDNYTILKSATLTPAQFFNEEDNWGTVEVGKNAELIILTENPLADIKNIITIETTILGKQIYNDKDLMDKL